MHSTGAILKQNSTGHPNPTFTEAQQEVADYLAAKGKDWTMIDNRYFLVAHFIEEVGELARSVLNLESMDQDPNRRGSNLSRKGRLALVEDSLGDLLFHLLKFAVAYRIDLQDAFRQAMSSIVARYPATPPSD